MDTTSNNPVRRTEEVIARLKANDAAIRWLGIEVREVAPNVAQLAITVRPEMLNSHGICHGGILFMLADTAFAYASNGMDDTTVTSGASIDFIAPVGPDETVVATAREIHSAARTVFFEVRVETGEGGIVAILHARGRRMGVPVGHGLDRKNE